MIATKAIEQMTRIITYGVTVNMVGRFGMRVDGMRAGGRTYKSYETALAKALEFAQAVHFDWTDKWMGKSWHFIYEAEPKGTDKGTW